MLGRNTESSSSRDYEAVDLAKDAAQFWRDAGGLLDILFARPDGVELGWHWLEHLLRQLPRRRPPAYGRGNP